MIVLFNTVRNLEVLTINDKNQEVTIHDKMLKNLMEKKGIDIPAFLQASYNNQSKVKLGDSNFIKAFKEIYWENNMNHNIYKWLKAG
jgi:hypothetical protein